ncbi:MAG: methyltransferase domain-containing protein [Dehalococcoidia bacterium]|nr:methyltransferase domain-containing protein [Dehalococcoidia bacterium]
MDTETNRSTAIPVPEILHQLEARICEVAIFRAALELEVWAKVAAGLDSVARLSAAEHWDPLGTRMLLDDLCSLKLLAREGDEYRLVPEAEHYLLPHKPTYKGRYLLAHFCWEGNGNLAQAIQTGKRPISYDTTTSEAIDIWIGAYSRSWAAPETYLKNCDAMWGALGIHGRDGLRVLDLACGPAPKSLALALANPGVQVTLVDWEGILQIARKVARGLGVDSRVTSISGDLAGVGFGRNQYDVAFLGDVTHFFSPEQNIRIFRKAYDALVDSGTLVVNAVRGEYLDPTEHGLWFYAVSAGGAYNLQEYKDMLGRARFTDIVDTNIPDLKVQPIKATKRSQNTRGQR